MFGGDRVSAHGKQRDLIIAAGTSGGATADARGVIYRGDRRTRQHRAGGIGYAAVQRSGHSLRGQERRRNQQQKQNRDEVEGRGRALHKYHLTVSDLPKPHDGLLCTAVD